jgi:hypothetical protein
VQAESTKPYKILRIQTFTTLDKGNSSSEIGGLILAAGKVTTVKWQRLLLCVEDKFGQEEVMKMQWGSKGIALLIL